MNLTEFQTRTYGKWILAGEHAVLRGCPALVFPLRSRELSFHFTPGAEGTGLQLKLFGKNGPELELLFRGVFEKALEVTQLSKSEINGEIQMHSNLPIGAGLGASASLCVALTRWFQSLNLVMEVEKNEFARLLENLFHGESSGVDIAVVSEESGLIFSKTGEKKLFQPTWKPRLFISYSGQRGMTYECVTAVKKLFDVDPVRAQGIDESMLRAVRMCQEAFEEASFEKLASGMELAGKCFFDWGLASGAVAEHIQKLKAKGAFAVKPTGSGGGGYVLSLWSSEPPLELQEELISCF